MDFVARRGLPRQFRTDMALCNLKTGKQETEKLRIVYLQLPLFEKKTEEECENNIFDCWIYILKNMNYFEMMPFRKKWPIFRKLAEISDLTKLSPEEQKLYDEDIKIMRDLYATQEFEEEMRKKDMEEALAKATAKAKAEAKAEAKAKMIASAKRLLAMGLSPEQTAQGLNLPLEEVYKLQNTIGKN